MTLRADEETQAEPLAKGEPKAVELQAVADCTTGVSARAMTQGFPTILL